MAGFQTRPRLACSLRWIAPFLAFGALCAGDVPTAAPLNPAFSAWRVRSANGPVGLYSMQVARPPLGLRPSPIDLTHIQGPVFAHGSPRLEATSGFPDVYDLRALGQLTPIETQQPFGSCWTFAAMGSLESSLLKTGRGSFSLAEADLAWFAYVDGVPGLPSFDDPDGDPLDYGGDNWAATAILARGSGAVSTSDCPYPLAYPWRPAAYPTGNEPVCAKLQQALYLGSTSNNIFIGTQQGTCSVDPSDLKTAIMNYGAVAVSITWDGTETYSPGTFTYRCLHQNDDHKVDIVGWDTGRKVWIARNSWGTGWGDSGYFYITDDSAMGNPCVFTSGPIAYSTIYQHDPLGWCQSWGYDAPTAWFASVFTAKETGQISAVSFYAAAIDSSYEISIHTGVTSDPSTGTAVFGPQTGSLDAPGYRMVALSSPVAVTAGQTFAVVVKLTTPGYSFPVPIQTRVQGYSSEAAAHPGESYCSKDGLAWTDMTTITPNTSACLKALATSSADLNLDGAVDVSDLAVLAAQYGSLGSTGFLSGTGPVGDQDIALWLTAFQGATP